MIQNLAMEQTLQGSDGGAKDFFEGYARDFDHIYDEGGKGALARFVDTNLRKEMRIRFEKTFEALDPMQGREDLRAGCLRHCSDRFCEDPLRVLRVMQFAARFDFDVHADTVALSRTLDLGELPRERIEVEWKKLLLQGRRPSKGLKFLADCGALRFFPEIQALQNTPQNPEWHPEGDVFVHTLHCMDHFAAHRIGDDVRDWLVGLGILCHDFGKPATTVNDDGVWRSIGHDIAGEAPTRSFLERLTAEAEVLQCVVALVKLHLRPFEYHRSQAGDGAIRRLATQVDLRLLVRVAHSDHAGRPPRKDDGFPAGQWLLERAHALEVADRAPQPIVQGRHLLELGEKPGPHFKDLLDRCFAAQLDGEFQDLDSGRAYLQRLLSSRGQ